LEEKQKRIPRQPKGKLTPYKRKVIEEYLRDFNGAQALRRVGYKGKRIYERAYAILHEDVVQEEIARRVEMELNAIGVHSRQVLIELARVGFSDIRKIFNPDGTLKPIKEIDDDTAAALARIERLERYVGRGEDRFLAGRSTKVRLFDKVKALEILAKHLKLFGEEKEAEKVKIQVLIKGRDVPFDNVIEGSDRPSLTRGIDGKPIDPDQSHQT
jgi:phage terminase small subunit